MLFRGDPHARAPLDSSLRRGTPSSGLTGIPQSAIANPQLPRCPVAFSRGGSN